MPRKPKPARSLRPESSPFTADFRAGFEVETGHLLRRRFLWFAGVLLLFSIVSYGIILIAMLLMWRGGLLASDDEAIHIGQAFSRFLARQGHDAASEIVLLTGAMTSTLVYIASFAYVWFRKPTSGVLLRITMAVVIVDGFIAIFFRQQGVPNQIGLGQFLISHFLASLFLPWSARQAIIPVVIVLTASALSRLMLEGHTLFNGGHALTFTRDFDHVWILLSPIVGLPGIAFCWIRQSRRFQRYSLRYFRDRYGEMRRELVDARRLHESLFPPPIESGPVRVAYAYEPMRQIGGDFLYTHQSDSGRTSVVLIDVTGHGIPAALTVNRLHGELERVFGENPDATPGEVLKLLNRYVHLTLSSHSVYVTAICLRADPARDELVYASGGHPPAFLRAVDGSIEQLDSTTFVLGAVPDSGFDPEPRTLRFGAGDTLIAYTDGATECRDESGRMFNVAGIQRLVATVDAESGSWPERIRGAVESHRFGPIADDTLVVELGRALASVAGEASTPTGARRRVRGRSPVQP